jgi:4-amino-4-deoxy-L-arabinose transferase-like glycosyltransferase
MLRRIPRPLALLLAVAALLSVAWSFTLAPMQGPDEPAHFNYAQHLAETGKKPTVAGGDHPDSSGVFASLFFLGLDQLAGVADARPSWSPLEQRRFEELVADAGEEGEENGAGPNPLAKNPPLYYAYEALPYYVGSAASFWDRFTLMRLASGLLFLVTVTCTWLAASELFTRMWPRVLATGCVALLPQLTALSGTINSDNLLVAVWTAFAFVALRIVRRGPDARWILALCALTAASLLTHGRGLAILAPLVVTLAIALLRARPRIGQAVRWLAPGVVLLLLAAAAYRFALQPSAGGAYGGEVVLAPSGGMSLKGFLNVTWQFYFPKLPLMDLRIGPEYGYRQVFIETFFGKFATLEISYPGNVYSLIQGLCALGFAGLVWTVVRRWPAVRARWAEVVVLATLAASMIGLLHLASYRALVGSLDPLITGRYVLPVVVVFGLTVAFVIGSLRPRASAVGGALVLSGLLALNAAGLLLTLTRFYG